MGAGDVEEVEGAAASSTTMSAPISSPIPSPSESPIAERQMAAATRRRG